MFCFMYALLSCLKQIAVNTSDLHSLSLWGWRPPRPKNKQIETCYKKKNPHYSLFSFSHFRDTSHFPQTRTDILYTLFLLQISIKEILESGVNKVFHGSSFILLKALYSGCWYLIVRVISILGNFS